eukprot:2810070-Amphidinium_carterae.1
MDLHLLWAAFAMAIFNFFNVCFHTIDYGNSPMTISILHKGISQDSNMCGEVETQTPMSWVDTQFNKQPQTTPHKRDNNKNRTDANKDCKAQPKVCRFGKASFLQ